MYEWKAVEDELRYRREIYCVGALTQELNPNLDSSLTYATQGTEEQNK
jgi:hypothetical protein